MMLLRYNPLIHFVWAMACLTPITTQAQPPDKVEVAPPPPPHHPTMPRVSCPQVTLFFSKDSSSLGPEASDMLRSVAPGINTNCTKITVTGLTSHIEPAALAQKRARAVFDALLKYGVDTKRLVIRTDVISGLTSNDQDETALQRVDIVGVDGIS